MQLSSLRRTNASKGMMAAASIMVPRNIAEATFFSMASGWFGFDFFTCCRLKTINNGVEISQQAAITHRLTMIMVGRSRSPRSSRLNTCKVWPTARIMATSNTPMSRAATIRLMIRGRFVVLAEGVEILLEFAGVGTGGFVAGFLIGLSNSHWRVRISIVMANGASHIIQVSVSSELNGVMIARDRK